MVSTTYERGEKAREACLFTLTDFLPRLLGRALAVVPRSMFKNGYVDVEHDDYQDSDFLKGWQETVLATSHRTAVSQGSFRLGQSEFSRVLL